MTRALRAPFFLAWMQDFECKALSARLWIPCLADRRAIAHSKLENILGALSLALTDSLMESIHKHLPSSQHASAHALIGHAPGLTIRDLSRVSWAFPPSVSVRLVDPMVADGCLKRERASHDGRAVALTLTDEGRTAHPAMLGARQSVPENAIAKLSGAELKSFGTMAQKVLRGISCDAEHMRKISRLCDSTVCHSCPLKDELRTGPLTP